MTKRIIGIVLTVVLMVAIYFLNKPIGSIPAIGYFLSPTHGFWKNISISENNNCKNKIKCPKSTATVFYDEIGVPHIFADNEEDLYFAQGYTVAKDRLWQMEFQTHAAAGRLTELVGEKALNLDRFSRRIGLLRAAETGTKEMLKDEVTNKIVTAYCNGVNAYIKQLNSKKLPLEYKLIGYKPEKWTPLKCALLLKFMAKDLTFADTDIENTNALRLFGEETFKLMYPDFPTPLDPIIPNGTKWNFTSNDTTNQNVTANSATLYQKPFKEFYAKKGIGSNNWAVAGSKTKSGKPILCNDPHLGLNLPSIWYEMQLNCPNLNVYGVTIPGSPGIVIGHNNDVAWGVTNASRDVINSYTVEYKTGNKKYYKRENKYVALQYDVQKFILKGNKKPFIDSIRMTEVGPIVYDENFGDINDKKQIAIYWKAYEVSNELKTFYLLNRAKNLNDYKNALSVYGCPGQNFVFADKENNIAIQQQGSFFTRTKDGEGKFIQPLATANLSIIKNNIPTNQNPTITNPERGFVCSANQNPTDKNYPYYTNGSYENYRNRVISNTLTNTNNIVVDDMMKLQNNNLSLLAKEILPIMLACLPDTFANKEMVEYYTILKNWNYVADYKSNGASLFYKWWEIIEQSTWDELIGKDVSFVLPENYVTANLIVNNPTFLMFDLQATTSTKETANDIIKMSFGTMAMFFDEYEEHVRQDLSWRFYKNTSITHLAKLEAFSLNNLAIGGYKNIVNATAQNEGASWRMIVDFANGKPQAYGVYPGGQSGNPASKNYTNLVEKWTKGEYFTLHFYANKEDAEKELKLN